LTPEAGAGRLLQEAFQLLPEQEIEGFHRQNQKIAACGSSYFGMHFPVGAAEGCELLIFR
jgi:hypothetical protein